MERPFFSIITVCYNAGDGVRRAIEALRKQTCGDYEHIIKDGGSTDGSIESIRPIAESDGRISVTVSPDDGIYDAMNQAIAQARGEYIYFLNCGDGFADERVLDDVKRFASETNDTVNRRNSVIYGDFELRGEIIRQPERITALYLYRRPLNHQSAFFERTVFDRLGNFDTALSIRADHELTLRCFRAGIGFLRTDRVINAYEGGGFSEREDKKTLRAKELEIIRERHFSEGERKRFALIEKCGFSAVRKRLRSPKSPEWIRRLYRRVANWFSR